MTTKVVAVAPAQSISTAALTPPASSVAAPVAPNIQTLSLPPECGSIKLGATHSVIICKPIPDSMIDKLLVAAPSVVISLIALVVSTLAFRYNKNKDSTARDLSIQDDYWLRKIVSPASIEPFLKLSAEIIAELPTIGQGELTEEAAKNWYDQRHTSLLRLATGFRLLELLDAALFQKVEVAMQAYEDELANYMGEIGAYLRSGKKMQMPVRATAVRNLSAFQMSVLGHIQSHQLKLGKK